MTIQENRNTTQLQQSPIDTQSDGSSASDHSSDSLLSNSTVAGSNAIVNLPLGSGVTTGVTTAGSASQSYHHHHHHPHHLQLHHQMDNERVSQQQQSTDEEEDNYWSEKPLQNGCEDKWSWSKRDRSKEVWLSDNNRAVHFHPNWSKGTAGIRGTRVLNNGRYYWELEVSQRVFGTR